MTIEEFLLARIAEDEAVAREAQWAYQHVLGIDHWFPANSNTSVAMTPLTALRECEAKRRIVEDFTTLADDYRVSRSERDELRRFQALVAVSQLASVYAGHADYRDEWRV